MSQPGTLNLKVIERLWTDAEVLFDEARAALELARQIEETAQAKDPAQQAFCSEAMRLTSQMMHAMNWLQKHREYLSGTLSESQLLRHGRLGRNFPAAEPGHLELLTPEMVELIRSVEGFYARLLTLDQGWHGRNPNSPSPVANMLEGLKVAFRE